MARLLRLMRLLGFGWLCLVGVARADVVNAGFAVQYTVYMAGQTFGPAQAATVCSDGGSAYSIPDPVLPNADKTACVWYNADGSIRNQWALYATDPQYSCPANSTPNDPPSTCTCSPGFVADGGTSCVPKPCGAAGTPATGPGIDGAVFPGGVGSQSCVGGCAIQSQFSIGVNGQDYSPGPFVNTGQKCTAGSTPLPKTDADCVTQGMVSGTVNGVVVCVPSGTPVTKSSQSSSSSTNSPSGGGTSTSGDSTTTTTDNGNGSTTTTTVTHNPDGSTSTSTTIGPNSAVGAAVAASGAADPQADFCVKHPDSSICLKSTFGGTCSSNFTCSGDAVQCAIAQEQHQRGCAFFQPETLAGTTGLADVSTFARAHADGDQPGWSPAAFGNIGSVGVDFASGIDQTHPFGSACLADRVIPISGGANLVIPWSQFCSGLQMAGLAIVAVTFVACAFIVFGK